MTTECKEPLPWTEMLMRTGSKKKCSWGRSNIKACICRWARTINHGHFQTITLTSENRESVPLFWFCIKTVHCSAQKKVHCSIWRSEYAKLALNHHHLSNDLAANLRRHQLTQDSTQKKSGSSSQVSVSLIRQRQFEAPAGSQKGIHASAQAIPRKLRSGARCRSEECPHLIIVY